MGMRRVPAKWMIPDALLIKEKGKLRNKASEAHERDWDGESNRSLGQSIENVPVANRTRRTIPKHEAGALLHSTSRTPITPKHPLAIAPARFARNSAAVLP